MRKNINRDKEYCFMVMGNEGNALRPFGHCEAQVLPGEIVNHKKANWLVKIQCINVYLMKTLRDVLHPFPAIRSKDFNIGD